MFCVTPLWEYRAKWRNEELDSGNVRETPFCDTHPLSFRAYPRVCRGWVEKSPDFDFIRCDEISLSRTKNELHCVAARQARLHSGRNDRQLGKIAAFLVRNRKYVLHYAAQS